MKEEKTIQIIIMNCWYQNVFENILFFASIALTAWFNHVCCENNWFVNVLMVYFTFCLATTLSKKKPEFKTKEEAIKWLEANNE